MILFLILMMKERLNTKVVLDVACLIQQTVYQFHKNDIGEVHHVEIEIPL